MGDEYKNLKTAELSNWTGKAFIGERKHSKLIQNIDELSVPGIYFLTSQSKSGIQTEIYIGEADEVKKRINNHFANKDWWDDFIIFISKDSNLTKAHVRYLEKAIHSIAKQNITTINLRNSAEPPGSQLPNSDIDDMEIFLENMLFVLKNLGVIDFTVIEKKDQSIKKESIFYLKLTSNRLDKNGNVLKAKLIITNEGYRLMKGSYIEGTERKSFNSHSYQILRKKIENEGYFNNTNYDEILILENDLTFDSPSAAASVIKNRATNGRKEWKLKDGTTLDDFENK